MAEPLQPLQKGPAMIIFLLFFLLSLIFLLSCAARVKTPYDQIVDDQQQLLFLSQYKKASNR